MNKHSKKFTYFMAGLCAVALVLVAGQSLAQAARKGKAYIKPLQSALKPAASPAAQVTPPPAPRPEGGVSAGEASVVAVPAAQSGQAAPAASNGAYVILSSYYLLPGQSFTVTGRGFSANETVELQAGDMVKTAVADGAGQFTGTPFTVTMSSLNSTLLVSARGLASGILRGAVAKVGTYYPVVSPSSYYLTTGDDLSFSGTGFAPNEKVNAQLGKQQTFAVQADSSGSFNTLNFKAPGLPQELVYTFTGESSRVSAAVKVKIGAKNP